MTALEILHKHWSYEAFRPLQEDIIKSILEKRDTVALLPTGGGKSICYQIPALMFSGYTLVVSPLIALMQNQVAYLHSKGIKAIYLHANLGQKKYQQELENIKYGKYTLVYISPERLENKFQIIYAPDATVEDLKNLSISTKNKVKAIFTNPNKSKVKFDSHIIDLFKNNCNS